jgi:hypothetical protein
MLFYVLSYGHLLDLNDVKIKMALKMVVGLLAWWSSCYFLRYSLVKFIRGPYSRGSHLSLCSFCKASMRENAAAIEPTDQMY